MSNQNSGGPAFPTDCERQNGPNSYHFEGMTLRDYFAAKAMQGALSNPDLSDNMTRQAIDLIARESYAMADAMLKERDK